MSKVASQRYAFVRGPHGGLVAVDDAATDELLESFREERRLSTAAMQRAEGSARAVARGLRRKDSGEKFAAVLSDSAAYARRRSAK